LKVSDAPAASVVLDQVNVQTFDCVYAELPLPTSGPRLAPEGTASFVQWSPPGIVNRTEKPFTEDDVPFLTVIVPQ
jgi:hypothetical protein